MIYTYGQKILSAPNPATNSSIKEWYQSILSVEQIGWRTLCVYSGLAVNTETSSLDEIGQDIEWLLSNHWLGTHDL